MNNFAIIQNEINHLSKTQKPINIELYESPTNFNDQYNEDEIIEDNNNVNDQYEPNMYDVELYPNQNTNISHLSNNQNKPIIANNNNKNQYFSPELIEYARSKMENISAEEKQEFMQWLNQQNSLEHKIKYLRGETEEKYSPTIEEEYHMFLQRLNYLKQSLQEENKDNKMLNKVNEIKQISKNPSSQSIFQFIYDFLGFGQYDYDTIIQKYRQLKE